MPIKIGVKTKPVSYEDFHAVDYEVMGIVFSIHRELGRLWNEKIYQNELVHRCRGAGFESITASLIRSTYFAESIQWINVTTQP